MPNRGTFLAVFGLALAFRLIGLALLHVSPWGAPDHGDMNYYHGWGTKIAEGQWTDYQAFYGMPGYAYMLGLFYMAGLPPLAMQLLQVLSEAIITCLILILASLTLSGTKRIPAGEAPGWEVPLPTGSPIWWAAFLSAIGYVLFIPAQTYSVILMPTTFLVLIFWGLVLWILIRSRRASFQEWLLAGAVLGVMACVIATILFLIPLLLLSAWLPWQVIRLRRSVANSLALVAGVAVATSPVYLHNYLVAKEPVMFSAHSGLNFYMGNHAEATGYPTIPEGLGANQADLLFGSLELAREETGRDLTRAEVSEFWSEKAREFVREERGAWLRLKVVKVRNFWNAFEYDDLNILELFQLEGITLPGIGFGLVAVFALPGVVVVWRRFPASRWIAAAVLLHLAALLPVFVTERYRLAAVPGLLILAVGGLYWFWLQIRSGAYKPAGLYLVAVLAALLFVGFPPQSPSLWAIGPFSTGLKLSQAGDFEKARPYLLRANELSPDHPEVNLALGNLMLADREWGRALAFYQEVLTAEPDHHRAMHNAAYALVQSGRHETALGLLERILAEEPGRDHTWYLYADALNRSGRTAEAGVAIRKALDLKPDEPVYQELARQLQNTPNH